MVFFYRQRPSYRLSSSHIAQLWSLAAASTTLPAGDTTRACTQTTAKIPAASPNRFHGHWSLGLLLSRSCRLAKLLVAIVHSKRSEFGAKRLSVASAEVLKAAEPHDQPDSNCTSEHTGSSSSNFGVRIMAGFSFLGTSIGSFSISIVSTTVIARRLE